MNIPLKLFVREIGEISSNNQQQSIAHKFNKLTGDEAKSFYDELVNSAPAAETSRPRPKRVKFKNKAKVSANILPSANIFKVAQYNDIRALQQLLNAGVDVNQVDDHGWTALMCAACSGAEEAVKVLVNVGAAIDTKDRLGYNAVRLARRNKHTQIVKYLRCYANEEIRSAKEEAFTKERETYFCKKCNETFPVTEAEHTLSIPHLLREKRFKNRTFYGISETNRGFQLMLRSGWDRDKGLGPHGKGRKLPIKGHLKSDRCGVGASSVPPLKSVTRSQTTTTLPRTSQENKLLERNFRLQFN